jgi:glycosyltransferase involved in cell wall biosynthesis
LVFNFIFWDGILRNFKNIEIMVSVIVTTFNRPDSLENCIKHLISIEDYNYIIEIIVIDDCSTYNLANQNKLFCQDITKVKYYYNLENRGLAYSRNIGASNSIGDYIFFLDDDIMVQENYFKNQLDLLKSNNCVTIGNISFSKSALNNNNLMKYVNSRYLGSYIDSLDYYEILNPSNFAGGISGFKRISFLNSGGFPTEFKFYGGEDVFFGHKLITTNIKIFFVRNSKAIHDDEVSFERYKQKQIIWASIGYKIIINKFPEIENFTSYKFLTPIKPTDSFSIKSRKFFISILFCRPIVCLSENIIKITNKQSFFYSSLFYRFIFASWFWLGFRNKSDISNVYYGNKLN